MTKIIDKRMKKTAGILDTYGVDYQNQQGKVTPYHILFKDFGDDIGSLSKDDAAEFVTNKINELQANYAGDEGYQELRQDEIDNLLASFDQVRDGMGVLFKIKDFLLEAENSLVVSSLNTILSNPKTASKVASIINGLLKAHEVAIKTKKK